MSSTNMIAADRQPTPVPLTEDSTAHSAADLAASHIPPHSLPPVPLSPTTTYPSLPTPSLPASLLSRVLWLGGVMLEGLEYAGEALADFLGITSSRYQYVIDAKERTERWERMEEAEEEAARVKLEDEQRQQQMRQQSSMEEGHTTGLAIADATAALPLPSQATTHIG